MKRLAVLVSLLILASSTADAQRRKPIQYWKPVGGVKLRAGPASVQPYLTGVSLQATFLVAGNKHSPCVGGEFHLMISGLNGGVGVLTGLSDVRPDGGVFISIGIGY